MTSAPRRSLAFGGQGREEQGREELSAQHPKGSPDCIGCVSLGLYRARHAGIARRAPEAPALPRARSSPYPPLRDAKLQMAQQVRCRPC